MKMLERIYLSTIRKPMKTILLLLVVFIMSNILSGSLILYKTTQSIKDNIIRQIPPSVTVYTGLSSYFDLDTAQIKQLVNEENYETAEKYGSVFKKMQELDGITYSDYAFMDYCTTIDKYRYPSYTYEGELGDLINIYNQIRLSAVNSTDPYYLHNGFFELKEGRTFTQEEIDQGSPVIIVPSNLYLLENKK